MLTDVSDWFGFNFRKARLFVLTSSVIDSFTYVHIKNTGALFVYLKQEQTHKYNVAYIYEECM